MSTRTFVKGHSGGSAVVVVIDPDGEHPFTEAEAQLVCDVSFGVGAATLVRLIQAGQKHPFPHLVEANPDVRWFAEIVDHSGKSSSRRASALRVAALALVELGYEKPERRDTLPFLTPAGVCDVLIGVASVTADLGRWRLAGESLVKVAAEQAPRPALGVRVDADYAVVALPTAAALHALNLNEPVSFKAEGENRPAQVVFVAPADNVLKDGVGQIHARVFDPETGQTAPEGEALAAAALAFRHWGGADMPHHWRVETLWGSNAVRMFPTEAGEHVSVAAHSAITVSGEFRA